MCKFSFLSIVMYIYCNSRRVTKVTYKIILHTFALPELLDFMLIISMIWISRIQEVKFWIVLLILSDSRFKLRTISGNKTSSLVNNIFSLCEGHKFIKNYNNSVCDYSLICHYLRTIVIL